MSWLFLVGYNTALINAQSADWLKADLILGAKVNMIEDREKFFSSATVVNTLLKVEKVELVYGGSRPEFSMKESALVLRKSIFADE